MTCVLKVTALSYLQNITYTHAEQCPVFVTEHITWYHTEALQCSFPITDPIYMPIK